MRETLLFIMHFVMLGFTIAMLVVVVPEKISILKEEHQFENICEYKYNFDNCYLDYSNDYIKVFKTDKGYVIEEN